MFTIQPEKTCLYPLFEPRSTSLKKANSYMPSFLALRLGFAAYIIPFVFALSPALLLVGSGGEIVEALLFTVAGTFALAISFEGWLGRPLGLGSRAALLVLGLLLLGFYVTVRI